ncbi:NERD domain-containing protein [Nocardia sp. NPDC005366]|uniref:nuclease-related domain-containing protein n=1 Tax=Nocardia sp. NPDC005366 TaxID=3156878 RepID=UPI00339F5FEB
MLVINERAALPRSEQRVLDWMRTWTGQYIIVGLAISGCYVPERHREGDTQEADLVVITPRAVVVIEVKGTVPDATSGVLSVQANGRWRLSGFDGDPIHVRDSDTSPFDQVTNNVFNLKELVRKHHADAYVDGLIVVVPSWESTITLEVESRQHGCGVVLGSTPGELRAWLHRTSNRKLLWTAEAVHALLVDLNLGDQLTVEDLLAEGFPSATGRRVARSPGGVREPEQGRDEQAAGAAVAQAYPDHLSSRFARRNSAQSASSAVRAPDHSELEPASEDSPPSDHESTSVAADHGDTRRSSVPVVRSEEGAQISSEQFVSVAPNPTTVRAPAAPTEDDSARTLNYAEPLSHTASAQLALDALQPASSALHEAHEPAGTDYLLPSAGTEHGRTDDGLSIGTSHVDTAAPPAPVPPPYSPETISPDAQPRRLPESGGQRPHHALSPRADHQSPWIAPDPDADSPHVPRIPATYVQPPWIPPDDEAVLSPPRIPTDRREITPDDEVDLPPTTQPASAFTDRWSSWIESDDAPPPPPPPPPLRRPTPYRAEPVPAPQPPRANVTLPVAECLPLRRNVAVAVPENPTATPLQAWVSTIRERVPSRLKFGDHLPQQLAAVAVIALCVGVIWVMVSTGSSPAGTTVTPPVQQSRNGEVVAPPEAQSPSRVPISMPPVCFPLPSSC